MHRIVSELIVDKEVHWRLAELPPSSIGLRVQWLLAPDNQPPLRVEQPAALKMHTKCMMLKFVRNTMGKHLMDIKH